MSDELLLDEDSFRIEAMGDTLRVRSRGGSLGELDRTVAFPSAARRALVDTMVDVQDLCDDARAGAVGLRVHRLAIGERTIRYTEADIDDAVPTTPATAKLRAARGTLLTIARGLLDDVV